MGLLLGCDVRPADGCCSVCLVSLFVCWCLFVACCLFVAAFVYLLIAPCFCLQNFQPLKDSHFLIFNHLKNAFSCYQKTRSDHLQKKHVS